MPGDKKVSDLSSRLKRPGKSGSRSSKSPSTSSSSPISAPPKAAINTGKAKKEDLQRWKQVNEMLLHSSPNPPSTSSQSISEDNAKQVSADTSDVSFGNVLEEQQTSRINELEKALETARKEQEAMKEEIERMRRQGRLPDSQTSRSRPSSSSKRSMEGNEQEVDRRRSWSKGHSELEEEVYGLRGKLVSLQANIAEQDAFYKSRAQQQQFEWNELTQRLHHSEKEAQERSRQLLELKQSISSLTRVEAQVTDNEFVERMDQIYHRTREWIINNFRRSKLEFKMASDDTKAALHSIRPSFQSTAATDKIPFYQAIVAHYLMQVLNEPLHLGLKENDVFFPLRQLAWHINKSSIWVIPSADFQAWRRSSIRLIQNCSIGDSAVLGESQQLWRIARQIFNVLTEISGMQSSQGALESLFKILQSAAELNRVLVFQKARYLTTFIRHDDDGNALMFDASIMESISDDYEEGEDDSGQKRTLFCVFPLFEKFGDETGAMVDMRNVLLKAKICRGVG